MLIADFLCHTIHLRKTDVTQTYHHGPYTISKAPSGKVEAPYLRVRPLT